MGEDLKDAVVVITGSSSGIGRAAALAFADRGAAVVLAARRRAALEEVAEECEARGGQALVVPTDVSDERAVEILAQRAVDTFGRIDVWVNNAAVSLFAPFEEAPPEVFRRVIETNFFGYVHGARSALRCFREQGRGVLINVSSVVASMPQPYTSAYVASKYAIRGLSECIRMELALDEGGEIHVCHLMPASIDTPLFQQAANYTGRAVKALDPVIPAKRVAAAIVSAARNPRAETMVGGVGRLAASQHALAPRLFERMGARMVHRDHFLDRPADPTEGNLFVPMPEYASVSGGWSNSNPEGGRAGKIALGTAAVALPLALWAWRRRGT
jgi:NAD(P)-dependent dehydrogenase (short-subunit alcohol dehydrogenase family)